MKEISYQELNSWKEEGRVFVLLDVREPWEHEQFNIGGQLIPLGEIISRKDEIMENKSPVIVYCKRGIRSMIAIQRLTPHMPNVEFYNLSEGVYHLMK